MMANAHNCPTCMCHLEGTRDLRDTAPHSCKHDMRKFRQKRGGVKLRPRLFSLIAGGGLHIIGPHRSKGGGVSRSV